MKQLLHRLSIAAACLVIALQANAQRAIVVAEDCSSATVDGIHGEIWRVTENGKSRWVLLDANDNYLADAPQHCVARLTRSIAESPAPRPQPVSTPAPSASGGLSPTLQQEILQRHNHWRQSLGVPALVWSPQVAAFAQQWANELAGQNCALEHRPRSGPFAQRYGENLFAASAVMWSDGRTEVQAVAPSQVVDSWDSEKADYDYNANACAAGKVCGHYTQVVWASSRTLGCAMKLCPDESQVWVCNYDAPGNVVGEKPY